MEYTNREFEKLSLKQCVNESNNLLVCLGIFNALIVFTVTNVKNIFFSTCFSFLFWVITMVIVDEIRLVFSRHNDKKLKSMAAASAIELLEISFLLYALLIFPAITQLGISAIMVLIVFWVLNKTIVPLYKRIQSKRSKIGRVTLFIFLAVFAISLYWLCYSRISKPLYDFIVSGNTKTKGNLKVEVDETIRNLQIVSDSIKMK